METTCSLNQDLGYGIYLAGYSPVKISSWPPKNVMHRFPLPVVTACCKYAIKWVFCLKLVWIFVAWFKESVGYTRSICGLCWILNPCKKAYIYSVPYKQLCFSNICFTVLLVKNKDFGNLIWRLYLLHCMLQPCIMSNLADSIKWCVIFLANQTTDYYYMLKFAIRTQCRDTQFI